MRVAIIGTGYVGLTTGVCLASIGHSVSCLDTDECKIAALRSGHIPIYEPYLEELLADSRSNLKFTGSYEDAIPGADVVFIAVGTPPTPSGAPNLQYLSQAARSIGQTITDNFTVVVNKSTVPVGSTRVVEQALGREDVTVASNPEFLREGSAVHDFLHPDRIVIGCEDQATAGRVAALFEGIQAPVIVTDPASAETIKYASNAFLATKVSFVNAIANVCEAVGADVREVVLGMGYDRRIGFEFLKPGPGWGGSCFPKDTRALIRIAEDAGYDFDLLKGVVAVNDEQFDRVVAKVERMIDGLDQKLVAAWGLTFKARTDDLRGSPALEVLRRVQERGARVRAYDPAITETVDGIEVAADPYAACEGASVLLVLTEWDEFRWLDFEKVGGLMAERNLVDGRNLLDPAAVRRRGFTYDAIGRS
ncbi:MAG: UDP-glucose/GDP-mannose dehydrogenase family protein [Acidimicrobiia bacterium]|nr:UDP-glucose/GDP-mannose dehydrogenase family protein [Acidimicrobiia bacterium]